MAVGRGGAVRKLTDIRVYVNGQWRTRTLYEDNGRKFITLAGDRCYMIQGKLDVGQYLKPEFAKWGLLQKD